MQEKDKSLREEFQRYWQGEITSHKYKFDRQEHECALIKTLTVEEFKAHFEKIFFQDNGANRLDIHFNSQPHLAKQGQKEEVKAEGSPADATAGATTESASAAAAAAEETKEEAKEGDKKEEEPEPEVSFETERKHASISLFKKGMGLLSDAITHAYCTLDTKL